MKINKKVTSQFGLIARVVVLIYYKRFIFDSFQVTRVALMTVKQTRRFPLMPVFVLSFVKKKVNDKFIVRKKKLLNEETSMCA